MKVGGLVRMGGTVSVGGPVNVGGPANVLQYKLTRQSITATTFTDSLHRRVGVAVVCLTGVATATADGREDNEPLQCAATKFTSYHVQSLRAYNLINAPIKLLSLIHRLNSHYHKINNIHQLLHLFTMPCECY